VSGGVGEQVRVQWDGHLVRVYTLGTDDERRLVAVHLRVQPGTYSTKPEHRPLHRPARQAAYEAALRQRRDQPVDARLGLQVERVLHFIEGRRYASFLQALVDEAQKLKLLASQHMCSFPGCGRLEVVLKTRPKQSMNRHYLFDMCSATI